MKKTTKVISVLLVFAMMLTMFMPIGASAYVSKDEWTDYIDAAKGLYIAPGGDDTEMYFSWYGGKEGVEPTVSVSEKSDMSNPVVFKGTVNSSDKVERSNHVTATGLEKGKKYYYTCSDGTQDSKVYSFKTVGENESFSAMYVSDIHISGDNVDSLYTSTKVFNEAVNDAKSRKELSLILSGGDQATEGRPEEYYSALSEESVKSIPFAMAVGNHDVKRYTFDTIANYPNAKLNGLSKSLVYGDYYFVKGNALFLVIDSTNSSAADHYSFVKNAVEENPDVKWKIMMFHHDLYGGHIPTRNNENTLLRALLTPIIDRFGIDLVLSGHSHCYSQSHVIYKGKITQNTRELDKVTDPKGTIYLTNGTLRADEVDSEPIFYSDRKSEFIDIDCISKSQGIYNILDFTDDTITINSYLVGEESAFNTFTIEKTSNEGGHPDERTPLWYTICKYIGTIYNVINNISRKMEIAERG